MCPVHAGREGGRWPPGLCEMWAPVGSRSRERVPMPRCSNPEPLGLGLYPLLRHCRGLFPACCLAMAVFGGCHSPRPWEHNTGSIQPFPRIVLGRLSPGSWQALDRATHQSLLLSDFRGCRILHFLGSSRRLPVLRHCVPL